MVLTFILEYVASITSEAVFDSIFKAVASIMIKALFQWLHNRTVTVIQNLLLPLCSKTLGCFLYYHGCVFLRYTEKATSLKTAHSFSKYAKFSAKLTFLTPWYGDV